MLGDRPDPAQQTVARNSRPFLTAMGLALSVIVPILVATASSGADPTVGGREVRILEDVVRWDRRAHEFRHAVHLSNGLYVKTRCLSAGANRNPPYINVPYIVCVQTLSPDSTDLDDARSHMKVPSWR
ncbi:MAG: hypothetical protein ACREMC_02580 [Gemmatimonadales bacterium]